MKMFEFPVVGTGYMDLKVQRKAHSLTMGVPIELRHKPSDAYPSAIGVYVDDIQIGWVPDRGYSCSSCWSSVKISTGYCDSCGAPDKIVVGGMATRLIGSDSLSDYTCYVTQVDPSASFDVVRAKILL